MVSQRVAMRECAEQGSLILALWVMLVCFAACTDEEEPTIRVQLAPDVLDMMISDQWEREDGSTEARVYRHKRYTELRLHFASELQDVGAPLQVPHVKTLIGKELNLEYGGVSTRVSLGGNAMIKYTLREEDEYGEPLRREEWVIARPVGRSGILRVSISLRIPETAEAYEGLAELEAALDRRVGDARIPRA